LKLEAPNLGSPSCMKHKLIRFALNLFHVTRLHRLLCPFLQGRGVILAMHRVKPLEGRKRIEASRRIEITPGFLKALVKFFMDKGYQAVSMDGVYERGKVVSTISPSMDIQIASNFERYLYYLYGEEPARVVQAMKEFEQTGRIRFSQEEKKLAQRDFISASIDQEETLATIARLYRQSGYMVDPHTAVGVAACHRLGNELGDGPVVCLATAHPCKFPEAVKRATGKEPERPGKMKGLEDMPQRLEILPASVSRVKKYVQENALK